MTENIGVARVASLHVHPLKSAAALAVESMELDARGAMGDRRWMLIDSDRVAVTARVYRKLARIQPTFLSSDRNGGLMLQHPSLESIRVRVPHDMPSVQARIWSDDVLVQDAGNDVADWCSDAISAHCRMVYLAPDAHRPVAQRYGGTLSVAQREVMLSDGAPLLILSEASVESLNVRLVQQGGDAITVRRFRPNIFVSGVESHTEDTWSEIQIGDVSIAVGNTCKRCVMVNVDPVTVESSLEPLRTLSGYRRDDDGVMFGMNATHGSLGTIRVGDLIEVRHLK